MSLLTDALDYIQIWLKNNYPEGAAELLPGMELSEIEEILQPLPFQVPLEVYELYQWSRGSRSQSNCSHIFGFQRMSLMTLQSSVQHFYEYHENTLDFFGYPLFPLFEFDGESLCLLGSSAKAEHSPIIYLSRDPSITISYASLTGMITMMAEHLKEGLACKENAYYDPNVRLLSYEASDNRFSQIIRKNNPELPEFSISTFCKGIKQVNSESLFADFAIDSFVNQISRLKINWPDLSIDSLSFELKMLLLYLANDEDEEIEQASIRILEKLKYVF